MILKSFQVDAFTDEVFKGNPAAVVVLSEQIPDDLMLLIAAENNLPETAFLLEEGSGFRLRWFTPDIEMDLCGHATLASAHIIFTEMSYEKDFIIFYTLSGELTVTREYRNGDQAYNMFFPERKAIPAILPKEILDSLSIKPNFVLKARDYMLVYEDQKDITNIQINRSLIDQVNLGTGGVIITAPGDDCDFVSRFFTPGSTLFEDPVTGSAHCTLTPYWSDKLNKSTLIAKQLSLRGGKLVCILDNDRVIIKGSAVTYSSSTVNIQNERYVISN